ncbi:MAG TPA: DUF4252 domain-containing protein [Aquaticitalea sp.]|nr:DUF4252 domain-containing protein [Aquaticitalea sp.]
MATMTKYIVVLVSLLVALCSCNQGPSLQTYFVDNEQRPNFLSMDVPVKMLNIDKATLTDDQKAAYESVNKLNMLAYKIDSTNQNEYRTELSKIKAILDGNQYQELMRGNYEDNGKFVVKYLGDDDDIDEFILFGNSNDMGFAVVRILGKDMDPGKLMKLSSLVDMNNIDQAKMGQFVDFFK